MKHTLLALLATTALALPLSAPARAADAPAAEAVLATYADLAQAGYEDSLATAKALRAAIGAFVAAPSAETQAAAKAAWVAARVPYQQTEAFRFGNAIVDDWEGRVNAWPLDEGLIDYVDMGSAAVNEENELALLNVIASPKITVGGEEIDATEITPKLLGEVLHEAEGVESNVATGYHAIEFLLWGQDLNGTEAGAGARPYTDYLQGEGCTGGNCDRRAAYLVAAADLLVADLEEMAANWAPGGAARQPLEADPTAGIATILTGMGSLSYGELAGERIKLGLMLHDPEEEHDCFSDMTHLSHYYDGVGIRNVYEGRYTRVDGTVVSGPSLSQYVAAKAPAEDAALRAGLEASVAALGEMKAAAEGGMAVDQMIAMGNDEGAAIINKVVDALVAQTREIERVVAALGAEISVEGSDSLDNPTAVFQ
ncbi:peptidase [Rhodobacter xanthinilyticus]|uniref:Peptidase n=1 Tax=Rhodobacter xanthinilyticus TaxID=1850250 RepID=A0A1D9MA08_9RHOB|nr:imelysin family protein [Rhodobacter xanthinilyticus]AOZ68705.1 peptidase [Rhodobacter xanthinilyticus]